LHRFTPFLPTLLLLIIMPVHNQPAHIAVGGLIIENG
jgi:hypothetical protein